MSATCNIASLLGLCAISSLCTLALCESRVAGEPVQDGGTPSPVGSEMLGLRRLLMGSLLSHANATGARGDVNGYREALECIVGTRCRCAL